MGYLIEEGTDELPIPGRDERVVMKRQATWGDYMAVGAAIAGVEADGYALAFSSARTVAMIESWTLKQVDGSPLPITQDVIEHRLRPSVAAWLTSEAQSRYEERSEEDERPFDSSSRPSPTDTEPSEQTSNSSSPSTSSASATAGLPTNSAASPTA